VTSALKNNLIPFLRDTTKMAAKKKKAAKKKTTKKARA
jgi:hypothetical protein